MGSLRGLNTYTPKLCVEGERKEGGGGGGEGQRRKGREKEGKGGEKRGVERRVPGEVEEYMTGCQG